jgi:hypothetical protein
MNLTETLELLKSKERENGYSLKFALNSISDRKCSANEILRRADAFNLPAVNSHARIKWGCIFVRKVFELFGIADDGIYPDQPVFFVTLADESHLTSDIPQLVNIQGYRSKLANALNGLSYIGMIEPGYFHAIYDRSDNKRKNVISWHGHVLVWGLRQEDLAQQLKRTRRLITPIMPGLRAVHQKRIELGQFGYKLWYMTKSPRCEYSIGKRRKPDKKSGKTRYKQNSRNIRPGIRLKLFHIMRDIYLDQLALAGGDGRELLRKIKYEALREYRTKNGWHDRRP